MRESGHLTEQPDFRQTSPEIVVHIARDPGSLAL
jgi:hypothetical protein